MYDNNTFGLTSYRHPNSNVNSQLHALTKTTNLKNILCEVFTYHTKIWYCFWNSRCVWGEIAQCVRQALESVFRFPENRHCLENLQKPLRNPAYWSDVTVQIYNTSDSGTRWGMKIEETTEACRLTSQAYKAVNKRLFQKRKRSPRIHCHAHDNIYTH